ncbi:CBS domain-containing protein [Methylonatrum kenyense]|uniref:CBS domain-containing protein n=1 Tax=Methylonatrum kenyense TaxID=455253 RepID=UPI0020C1183E|nr:CBS domain-containing protein [Methylonatrum kenyense]MCK8516945.1 CBS domain-containing protein [Methylonatrum kenyense]
METPLSVVMTEKAALLAERGDTLYSVGPDTPAKDAIAMMCDANIGCVVVLENDKLVGIFSERDVMRRVANENVKPDGLLVRDVMTADLVTVRPNSTVEEALVECTDRRIRHLPVAEEGQLLGLLSIGDLVRYVVKDKDREIADLVDYIHGHQIKV